MAVTFNGALVESSFDTYASSVNWNSTLLLPLAVPAFDFIVDVEVLGEANPKSSNTWVQVVGAEVYF